VTDPGVHFPELGGTLMGIDRVTRKDSNVYLDATAMAEALFEDHMATNPILMGTAYQAGALPISAASIEEAIRLNGVSVQMNLLAFRWGRMAVVDAKLVEATVKRVTGKLVEAAPLSTAARELVQSTGATGELLRLLEVRVPELIDYQDVQYARQYTEFVGRVAREEQRRTPGRHGVSEAVARYLYKLMAYKDEYEVARLHLSAALQAETESTFGPRVKLFWHLHPPLLRALGLKKKVKLGRWFAPAFRALRAMKGLRGSALDPFGYAEVRRVERELIGEYRQMVETVLVKLAPDNHDLAVALAELPDEIRGYERIKLDNVKRFRERAAQLLARLN
jgi:indolepyruvate ferredoxin oxidoreductase